MTTLEQFQAKQAEELKAFQAKQARDAAILATGIPEPTYIGGKLHGAQTIMYANRAYNRTLTQALEHFKCFNIVPFNVLKDDSFTILFPEKHLQEKEKGYKRDSYKTSGYAVDLRVSHIQGSPAPTTARLEFFAMNGGILFDVTIEFGTGYIGASPMLRPKAVESYNGNRTVARSFAPNDALNGIADSHIHFASGDTSPLKTSADQRFLFVAEQEDDLPGSECKHALAQLTNLASYLGEDNEQVS